MCGLAGAWHFKTASMPLAEIGKAMADRLSHRGPDSSGVWVDESAGLVLGHRRLSIVDLSPNGHQPMVSPSNQSVLIYNGEIYNAMELREALRSEGAVFRGNSDTEVILQACVFWGVERAVKKLIGMFAFAFWDQTERRLYLVRDRLGIKPLYWGLHQGILFFGSELKSFFAHPQWRATLNRDALVSYFRWGYVPAPLSIYQDIFKLKPGHLVIIDDQARVQEIAYWQLSAVVASGKQTLKKASETEIVVELETLLKDAVKRRMVADVPLGAFLSGGIDSSTIVALMQSQSHQPIKSFTIGFEEAEFNEALCARAVAQHLGTDHQELVVRSQEAQAVIPQLSLWYDEPFADSSQIPTYLVSKLARSSVTVSLSGDGGDEVFAGYSRYLVTQSFWSWWKFIPLPVRKGLSSGIRSLSPAQWNRLMQYVPARFRPSNMSEKADKLATLLRTTPQNFYAPLVSVWADAENLVQSGKENFQWPIEKKLNLIEQMQYIDTMTYLPDDILTKVDRASMAVSLEARVPLLDHRVVELAWQIPSKMKSQGMQGKKILRSILNRYVPKNFFDRPKMGFGIPLAQWLRGPLKEWAENLLEKNKIAAEGILNAELVHARWQSHLKGERNFSHSLWSVLMFQAWHQQWMLHH